MKENKKTEIPQQTLPSAREAALSVLYDVETKGAWSNLALRQKLAESDYSSADRAFITELVYGVTRMKGNCDYLLELFLNASLEKLPPHILLILRMGIYQLRYLGGVRPAAAVDEAVKLAKKYGHRGTVALVNAVLRNYLRGVDGIKFPDRGKEPVKFLSAYYSYPRWLAGYFIKLWGLDEAEKFCAYANTPRSVDIRVNTLRTDIASLAAELKSAGIDTERGKYAPEALTLLTGADMEKLPPFAEGLFTVQDEVSMLASLALSPQPDSRVIDMCAAPGGKTTHLAQLCQNRGEIRAFDIHEHKIPLIDAACERMRIDIVRSEARDGASLAEDYREWADYLLLDAPCTGLGVLSRRADARWNKKYEDIAELAAVSRSLLSSAAACLKRGGVMVFSTCTVSKEENEDNLQWFMDNHADFSLESIDSLMPLFKFEEDISALRRGYIQLLPQRHELDGFFIARLRKA